MEASKEAKSGKSPANWFVRGKVRSTVTVPITQGGNLARSIRDKLAKIQAPNNRTQVIEETGRPIHYGLKRMDINNTLGCQYIESCPVTERTDCSTMRTSYRLDCLYCHPTEDRIEDISPKDRSIYLGCSGRSMHSRMVDHMKDMKAGDMSNAMVKHMDNVHPNMNWREDMPIRARRIKSHITTLRRLIDESLRLEQYKGLANSKGEWGRGGGLVGDHSTRTNN